MEINNLIITQARLASENEYIKKLINDMEIAAYYDLNALATKDVTGLKAYLLQRSLGVVEWGRHTILVDAGALNEKVNLNCFECTKTNETGCCCGSPCNYSQRNLKVFNAYKSELIKEMIRIAPIQYNELLENQVTEMPQEQLLSEESLQLEIVNEEGALTACKGRCSLLVREDGISKCLTHKFALEHNISVYELSPLSCLMFPMEILVFLTKEGKEILFITSVVADEFAQRYGRWGRYKGFGIPFTCVDFSAHNEQFKEADYEQLYKVNAGLLLHEFGEDVYEGICRICDV